MIWPKRSLGGYLGWIPSNAKGVDYVLRSLLLSAPGEAHGAATLELFILACDQWSQIFAPS